MTDRAHPTQTGITITSVFDPDGNGNDFSYTTGLAETCGVELHLWARPPDGFDPGHDWKLSSRDQARILSDIATRLAGGELTVRTRFSEQFDDGWTIIEFELREPTDAVSLDAYGLAAHQSVIPVRWQLHRPKRSAAPDHSVAHQLLDRLEETTDSRRALMGCDLPDSELGGTSSPEALSDTHAALLRRVRRVAAGSEISAWLFAGVYANDLHAWARGVCHTAAHATGNARVLEAAVSLARTDADAICDGWDDEQLGTFLTATLEATYSAIALSGLVSDAALAAGAGWFLALCDPTGAQTQFDTRVAGMATRQELPAGGGGTQTGDWLKHTVLMMSARAAALGMGAPLRDDDHIAFEKLTRAGISTPGS